MIKQVVLAGATLVAIAVLASAYIFLRPTAEASEPIQAIPLQLEASATAAPATSAEPTSEEEVTVNASPTAEESTSEAIEATSPTAEVEVQPTETTAAVAEATEAPAAASAATTEIALAASSEPIVFEIDRTSSQARYVIDEVLRGSHVTVVGSTNQVAGQIALDPANPAATQLGVIQINARTFATDAAQRDRVVQNRILSTDQYEYITFTPTSLVGLPESVEAGASYTFQVVGDLTIRDQARHATFDVTVTPVSETRLEGSATTTIAYVDWGLAVPSVPFVANVGETVRLELDFVATAP